MENITHEAEQEAFAHKQDETCDLLIGCDLYGEYR
jgi:hypothetical protein